MDNNSGKNYTRLPKQQVQDMTVQINDLRTKAASFLEMAEEKNYVNAFLIVCLIIFVISMAVSTRINSRSPETQADNVRQSTQSSTEISSFASIYSQTQDLPLPDNRGYPSQYNETPIPSRIYEQAEEQYEDFQDKEKLREYITSKVMRYYIYKDVIQENSIEVDERVPDNPTFSDIERLVVLYEDKLKETVVRSIDFGYIYAYYDNSHRDSVDPDLNIDNIKETSLELLSTYRQEFSTENADPETVIDQSNDDSTLRKINRHDTSKILSLYTSDEDFMFSLNIPAGNTQEFNSFLFNLTDGVVSEQFTILDESEKDIGAIIIYPFTVRQNTYSSLQELIGEKESQFSYN